MLYFFRIAFVKSAQNVNLLNLQITGILLIINVLFLVNVKLKLFNFQFPQ